MALPDASAVGGHGLEIVTALCGGYRVFPTANGKQASPRWPLAERAGTVAVAAPLPVIRQVPVVSPAHHSPLAATTEASSWYLPALRRS